MASLLSHYYPILSIIWLVVSTPLKKYEFVSWDDDIPDRWKVIKHVPKHQPAINIPVNRVNIPILLPFPSYYY